MCLQQNRSAKGGTVGCTHAEEQDRAEVPGKLAKSPEGGAEFRIAAIGVPQIEKPLRLLAALDFQDLRAAGLEQVRRRLNPVDPPRCFHIRVSHDTVLK